jgi:hypothetical protein
MLLLDSSVCGLFKWRQFEPAVILLAIGWYLRFSLLYRDVEELLAERGLPVDHVTVWRWVQRYAPELERRRDGVRHLLHRPFQAFAPEPLSVARTMADRCILSGRIAGARPTQRTKSVTIAVPEPSRHLFLGRFPFACPPPE